LFVQLRSFVGEALVCLIRCFASVLTILRFQLLIDRFRISRTRVS